MTREQAARRVTKLDALANDRAATGPEARLARDKAAKLRAQFDLRANGRRPKAGVSGRRPQRGYPHDRRPRSSYSLGDIHINFDPSTGKATKGTKVHHYQSPGNWRIEVPL